MRKGVIALLAAALLGGIGWRVYVVTTSGKDKSGGGNKGGAVVVEVAPVETASIRDVAQFTGSLYAKSYIVVAPKVAGRLDKLMVDIGDKVRSGDLIAVIDDAEYRQQSEQARAELNVAQANVLEAKSALDVEQREFDRVTALRDKKIASESEFDTAQARYEAQESRYKVSVAQVAQREAALKAADVRLSYTRISASWEDAETVRFVGERFADQGAMLRSNDPIVSVIDISKLTAVVHVIERDYSRIALGQKAAITTDAFPGRMMEGTIVRVAPLLKESSRQARIEIEVPNDDGLLKPGMFVVAHIELDRHDSATVVPVSALARQQASIGLFLVNPDRKSVRFVPVTVGIRSAEMAEIIEPVISGSVVTLGQHLLSDGAAVSVPSQAAPAAGSTSTAGADGDPK